MSHTHAFALIPGDTPANKIREKLWEMTSRYAEHYTNECITPCHCVGDIANHKVCTKAYNKAINAVKASKNKAGCTLTPDDDLTDEDRINITGKVNEILASHSLALSPDPECNTCGGAGTVALHYENDPLYKSIYIGGAFSGLVYGPDRNYESLQNKELFKDFDDEEILHNCRPVSEIPIEDPFYHANIIITPDGHLYRFRGQFSWGEKLNADETIMHKYIVEVFRKHSDHLVVDLDCRG